MKDKLLLVLLAFFLALCLKCGVHAQTGQAKTFTASTVGSTVTELYGEVPANNCKTFLGPSGYGCGDCTAPTNGTITAFNATTGAVVYKPNTGFIGNDAFTYRVRATGIVSGNCTGTVTDSASQYTINVVVTDQKTTVTAKLSDLGVMAISGKVAMVLGQVSDSPTAIIPKTKSVVVTLDGTGRFTASVYPSVSLFPVSAYTLVYLDSTTGRREKIGTYHIPASTATIDLNTCNCREIDAANDAKLSFATRASLDALITQVQSFDVQDTGTGVATRRILNFVDGNGISVDVQDDGPNNRVNVTVNCAACTGGSIATSTAGRPAFYSSNSVVSGAAFTGAHRLWTSNATNNGMEFKSIACSGGITCTPTPGQLAIQGTVQSFSLNSQTGASQTLNVQFTGSTFPTWNSAANVHNLILPDASPSVTHGLWTNGAQELGGAKTLKGVGASDVPLTIQQVSGGSQYLTDWLDSTQTLAGSFSIYGSYARRAAFGDLLVGSPTSLTNSGWVIRNFHTTSNVGTGPAGGQINSLTYSGGATSASFYGTYSTVQLSNSAAITSSFNAGARNILSVIGAGDLTTGAATRSELVKENGSTWTNAIGHVATASIAGGTIVNLDLNRVSTPVVTGGAITTLTGIYIEPMNVGAANYALYANSGLVSLSDYVEFRGRTIAGTSAVGTMRQVYDGINNLWVASINGGQYRRVATYINASTTLNFGTINANTCAQLTVTAFGATDGQTVWIGVPNSAAVSGVTFTGRVSAADTVTIDACNVTTSNKTSNSGTFTVRVGQTN